MFSIISLCFVLCIGYASSGGTMTINSYIDRDTDILMKRIVKRVNIGIHATNLPKKS